MRIISCYKIVPDEQDISVKPDRTLSLERAENKISLYDLNAVEAGEQLVQEVGGKLYALSVGEEIINNSKLKKDILSRGPEELYLVIDQANNNASSFETTQVLAAAAGKIGFDLILCGEGSADNYAQQTGILLGELLGIPSINAVSKITPNGEQSIIVERTLEEEIEILEISLPAVLSVTSDINIPKIPTMKSILAASKKPVTVWNNNQVGLMKITKLCEKISILAHEQTNRKKIILESDSDENVAKLLDYLKKEIN